MGPSGPGGPHRLRLPVRRERSFGDQGDELPADKGKIVLFGDGDVVSVRAGQTGARLLFMGGRPLREPVAWRGPIVMNTEEGCLARLSPNMPKERSSSTKPWPGDPGPPRVLSGDTAMNETLQKLVGKEVVVDTPSPGIYIGKLASVQADSLLLHNVDVHYSGETSTAQGALRGSPPARRGSRPTAARSTSTWNTWSALRRWPTLSSSNPGPA